MAIWNWPPGGGPSIGIYEPSAPPLVASSPLSDEFQGTVVNSKWSELDTLGILTVSQNNGLILSAAAPGAGVEVITGVYQAAPASEFAVYTRAHALHSMYSSPQGLHAGILINDGSARFSWAQTLQSQAFWAQLQGNTWPTPTTPSNFVSITQWRGLGAWLRVRVNGTAIHFDGSEVGDGRGWNHMFTGALAGNATQIGLCLATGNQANVTIFDCFRVFSGAGTSGFTATSIGRLI